MWRKAKLVINTLVPSSVNTKEELVAYLKKLFEDYAGSNDGSEFLANLEINENNVSFLE